MRKDNASVNDPPPLRREKREKAGSNGLNEFMEKTWVLSYKILDALIEKGPVLSLLQGPDASMDGVATDDGMPTKGILLVGEGGRSLPGAIGITTDAALSLVEEARKSKLIARLAYPAARALLDGAELERVLPVSFTRDRGAGEEIGELLLPHAKMITVGDCSKCEKCTRVCPVHAVRIQRSEPVFTDLCIGCGICAYACPRRNIRTALAPNSPTGLFLRERSGTGEGK